MKDLPVFTEGWQSITTRNMDLSLTLAVAGIILAFLWFGQKKSQRLPPGPFALPLIGNLPQLEKEAPFKSFIKVSLVGSFMCIDLGLLPAQSFTWVPDVVFVLFLFFSLHSWAKPTVPWWRYIWAGSGLLFWWDMMQWRKLWLTRQMTSQAEGHCHS